MDMLYSQKAKGESAFNFSFGKHTGKRPLGRLGRRWENNIRMDLKEIGVDTRNWGRYGAQGITEAPPSHI